MTENLVRPLLFLDVDGTLLPYGGTLPTTGEEWEASISPRLARIEREHGARLLELACELVWATAWMDDANEVIAPLLGLPVLRVADLDRPEPIVPVPEGDVHWKTATLVALAEGRPFIWVDDEIAEADREWVAAHHEGPALLHRVDANVGLTAEDLVLFGEWVRGLSEGSP